MEQTDPAAAAAAARPRFQSRSARIAHEVAAFAETESTAISDEHDNMLRNLDDEDEQVCLEAMDYVKVLEPSVIALHGAALAAALDPLTSSPGACIRARQYRAPQSSA